ncbi:hypothetical protein WMF31_23525 [Sorangium sp. So ce1036]|uniref:hypothetical protein n=1 Tax=Sorangium sp. So ce1036 TaxID=3133328 RepID=UPI003EFEDC23
MTRPEAIAERLSELQVNVLAPLVLGGPLCPVRPFGVRLALLLGEGAPALDPDLGAHIDVVRVRVARLVAPVDALPELTSADWALAAALNDLLQLTNHELAGPLTRSRYPRLLASVRDLCELVPAPPDVATALARHATFARVLECFRTDAHVSWWTGSASFRGQRPPARLLLWRRLRNVEVETRRVGLAEMGQGIPGLSPEDYADALALFLTRTPLTDLATATRRSPPFAWSASTLSVVAAPPGRRLAYRVMLRQPHDLVVATLARAAREVPLRLGQARALSESFASEVAAGIKLLGERSGAA